MNARRRGHLLAEFAVSAALASSVVASESKGFFALLEREKREKLLNTT